MDQIIRIFDGLVSKSSSDYKDHLTKKYNRWKICVALQALGWEVKEVTQVPSETDDIISVKLVKKGKEDVNIRLGFTDQQLWTEYLLSQVKEK